MDGFGDGFEDVLELESKYYDEGYKAGIEDGKKAGAIEGKLFGLEKGFEKALEVGRLQGRAMVWQSRLHVETTDREPHTPASTAAEVTIPSDIRLATLAPLLDHLPKNERLRKHIESLLALTSSSILPLANTDDAVADFDDKIARAHARGKVIANIIGESVEVAAAPSGGIEDARGLKARH